MPTVDLVSIEERLARAEARPILVDSRLLRRIIKRHRGFPGLGLEVPHARCYALPRAALLALITPAELGRAAVELPDEVILLPRPTDAELRATSPDELLTQLWRAAFHAAIHLEIERRVAAGVLTSSRIRQRIHRIGETEFDEIRLVLRHDDQLLPPYDDSETFTEFAALYLELRSFDPTLLLRLFPTMRDRARVDGAVDVDAAPLLDRTRPDGAPDIPPPASERAPQSSVAVASEPAAERPRAPALATMDGLLDEADVARRRGNDVRAALLALAARAVAPAGKADAALARSRAALASLAARLDRALHPDRPLPSPDHDAAVAAWTPLLLTLARGGFRRRLRHTLEARLLFDLQRAAVARERPQSTVDLVERILSFGRRPVVRPLPAAIDVRVARSRQNARKKLAHVRMDAGARHALGELLHHATERADENVRVTLRPKILAALDAVGLTPRDTAEQVARLKLTEELLDLAVHQGHFGIGHLRDALSRNQLKLDSLSGPVELFRGDPLIKTDRLLALSLDGVYRRAEIYLRTLQRISSVAFGTAPGRLLTRYLLLPVGGAYVLLKGLTHLVELIAHLAHAHPVELLNNASLAVVSVVLFGLINSAKVRDFAHRALSATGWVLSSVFVRFPRYVARLPLLQALYRSPFARVVTRYLLKPLAITAVPWVLVLRHRSLTVEAALTLAILVVVEIALNSPAGVLAEELMLDWIFGRVRVLSRQVLPGLFHLVASFFRSLTELVERAVYTVDEWLRFREGQSVAALAAKALLGFVWFFVVYLIRIAVNLLIEPQINPIKHFPVVTVAHKMVLPFSGTIIPAIASVLSPVLGKAAAQTIAAPAPVLIPGVFGFLVWELKENWKLYRSTRAKNLRPVAIGHHGETMSALMKPGFHSGTLPKLYQRARRAARRGDGSLEQHDEALREVEEAVHHFGERELGTLLQRAARFRAGVVRVEAVELGSNRVTLVLGCEPRGAAVAHEGYRTPSPKPRCRIAFEEQSGLLLASIPEPGFLDTLDDEERVIAENAIAGLYHLAGVDVTREQLEAAIQGDGESAPPYDIGGAGLVVWPQGTSPAPDPGGPTSGDREYTTEVVYDFRLGPTPTPTIRGEAPAEAPPRLDARVVFFRNQPIAWTTWVAAWEAASAEQGVIPRVLDGVSILPRRSGNVTHSAA